MRETGVVLSNRGMVAQVRILRSPQCAGCHGCIELGEPQERIIEAENEIGAPAGSVIECEIASGQVIGHTLLVFLFPLFGMAAGYYAAITWRPQVWPAGEGIGIAGAFTGLALAFVLVRLFDKLWGKKHPTTGRVCGYAGAGAEEGDSFSCPQN